MVFEEVILAAQEPRIVLLDVEEVEILDTDNPVLRGSDYNGWQFRVENREELRAERPKVVARSLLGVCSASRHVAARFLDRPDEMIKPRPCDNTLMALGLSLTSDFFWLSDDLPRFMETCDNIPAGWGPPEEDYIESIMLSLHTFEQVFDLGKIHSRKNHENMNEAVLYLCSIMHDLFFTFSGLRNLVIMVDVPRSHISWDQLQVVGANDPTTVTMIDEDGPARCHSALEDYLALQSDYMKVVARERQTHEAMDSDDDDFDDSDSDDDDSDPGIMWSQQWPEISFAFLKPSLQFTSS